MADSEQFSPPAQAPASESPLSDDRVGCKLSERTDDNNNVVQQRLDEHLIRGQKQGLLDQFVAGIAHDFNNLLTAISGNLALLHHASDAITRDDRLHDAQTACGRAAELVRRLLAQSQQAPDELSPISLSTVVEEVLSTIRASIDPKITLSSSLNDGGIHIDGDSGQLHQVIMNLVLNARDAILEKMLHESGNLETDSNRECVFVPRIDVQVGTSLSSHPGALPEVFLLVRDSGTGVSEQVRSQMFNPFFTTKKEGHGTGLGLSMVHGIVERHKARISVENIYGEGPRPVTSGRPTTDTSQISGCEVRVSFPGIGGYGRSITAPVPHTSVPVFTPSAGLGGNFSSVPLPTYRASRGTVLLVEDEDPVRAVIEKMLRALGYQVLVAPRGRAGLELLTQHQSDVNVIFSDYSMPDMTGLELFAQVRASHSTVPLILCSGRFPHRECRTDVLPAKNTSSTEMSLPVTYQIIPKPFTFQDLADAVRHSIEGAPVLETKADKG